ncbi:MAG: hypothetical protein HN368_08835 [Spirochaetales bacterium]|nr:hypothetical protein [Spirochaetales bacterium]
MEKSDKILYLEPNRFPFLPKRLIDILYLVKDTDFSQIVIDWSGLFPWSLDERFRCEYSYSEHEVSGFHKLAADLGIDAIPCLPLGSGMACFLSVPSYRYLRISDDEVDIINPAAPGAAKFVCDLLNDIVTLLPDLTSISIDTNPRSSIYGNEEYFRMVETSLMPNISSELAGLQLGLLNDLTGAVSIEQMKGWMPGLPPTWEIFWDQLGAEGSRSSELRDQFSELADSLDSAWYHVRIARELAVSAGFHSESPRGYENKLGQVYRALTVLIGGLLTAGVELSNGLTSLIDAAVIQSWLLEQIEPLREEEAVIGSRYRQLTGWNG